MADDHDHEHGSELSETQIRVRALESALIEHGLVDPAALDALIETYETKVGPHNGARVVARAWRTPEYRERLLEDATAAIAELGYIGRQGEHMVAVENTPADAQHGRLHALLVLPVAGAGAAAGLVQERALPLARGVRAARRAGRLRRHAARGDRDPGLGLDRRGPLPGRADAPGAAPRAGTRSGWRASSPATR